MKHISTLCCIIFLLTSCSNLETIEIKDDQGNVVEKYTRKKEDFAKEGIHTKFSASGIKLEEANYSNNVLDGKRTIFDENGKPMIVENYVAGKFAGLYQSFHPNGQVELEGDYIKGAMQGKWKKYYKDGAIMEIVNFDNNEENGPFVEYHQNGKLKTEGAYKNGDNEHGLLKMYDPNGELEKKMNCTHGICRTIWTKEKGDIVPKEIKSIPQ